MMHIGDRKPKVYLHGRNRVARIVILVSYCMQIAKCRVLENFQGLKVRGWGQGLVNWSSRILEDEDFRRGQQLWAKAKNFGIKAKAEASACHRISFLGIWTTTKWFLVFCRKFTHNWSPAM